MGLRIKIFNTLGVHWKIWLLGGEFTKKQYRGGLPKKGRLGQFADLRGGGGGGLARKRGMLFLRGVDTPMPTMNTGEWLVDRAGNMLLLVTN